MKRILVPTDFSKTANRARDYAVKLAELFDAEIILLNAYHVSYPCASAGTLVNIDHIAKETAEKKMKEEEEYIQLNYPTLNVKYLCNYDLAVDSIKRVCEKRVIDLVVMGTTGASGFAGNLLGSNTGALIGSIKAPIIAVPDETKVNYPRNIVVANDLTKTGNEPLFDTLKEIAKETQAQIDFLVIKGYDDSSTDRKIQHLKAASFDEAFDTKYNPFHFRNDEDTEKGILDFIEDRKVDLLVVVAHQRNFWEKLFHISITKSLTKHAETPILVLHE